MRIFVELSEAELRDVVRFTGEKRKAFAIRKLVCDALMLRRRAILTEKFMTGEWSAELKGFENLRALDRNRCATS